MVKTILAIAMLGAGGGSAAQAQGWYWNEQGRVWECRDCFRGDMPIARPPPPGPAYRQNNPSFNNCRNEYCLDEFQRYGGQRQVCFDQRGQPYYCN